MEGKENKSMHVSEGFETAVVHMNVGPANYQFLGQFIVIIQIFILAEFALFVKSS